MSETALFVGFLGFLGMFMTALLGGVNVWRDRRAKLAAMYVVNNDRRERQIQRLEERVAVMDAAERYDGRPPSLVSELDAWQAEYDRACQMHEARAALRGLGPW